MYYELFHNVFPKIAERETRNLTVLNNPPIPRGEYLFATLYCNDKTCDCRRTIINVLQVEPVTIPKPIAVISYGWESMDFYRNWGSYLSDEMLKEFKGPCLDMMQPQSVHAEYFLDFFINEIQRDKNYANRIQRHYAYFKTKQKMKLPKKLTDLIEYNEPCPCGSGKNLKDCCLRERKKRGRWKHRGKF